MENATKALLIAGGVLIAIIIITMFVMMFNRISSIQQEQEQQTKMEQVAAFNAEYESYNKKVMYGADVITLINKVNENNKKYSRNADYQIEVSVKLQKDDDTEIEITQKDSISVKNGNVIIIKEDTTVITVKDFEKIIFTCKTVSYNNSGRISGINIEKRN